MNDATKDFAINHAICLEKQLQPALTDLFGGGNTLAPGAGDKIPVEGLAEFTNGSEYYTDGASNGTQYNGGKRKTAELPSLSSLPIKCYTQGIERLLLASLGYASPGGPVEVASSSGFFAHFFCIHPQGHLQRKYTAAESALVSSGYDEDDRINTYITVAQELGPYEHSLRNIRIKDTEFSGSAKAAAMLKVGGPAERHTRDENKLSCSTWTYAANAFDDWFMLSDCKCYIQPASTPFTVDSMPVSISDFNVKVSHGLSDDNIPTGTSNGGLSRAEPRPSGKSSLTAELGIYLHDKTVYEDWRDNQTVLHAKLVFERGNYKKIILLPRLVATLADPNFDGAGSVKLSLDAAYPTTATDIAALASSFAAERAIAGTTMPWPASSLIGVIVVSKESRNTMRWG